MAVVLASVIAVLGTLAGATAGYLFQRRISERSEMLAREDRLRQERMAACGALAGAVMDLRRAQYDKWHRRHDDPGHADPDDVRAESYRLRSMAWTGFYRFKLTCTDAALGELALRAIDKAGHVDKAADEAEVRARGDEARECLERFVAAAATQFTSPMPALPAP